MDRLLPSAKSVPAGEDRRRVQRVIAKRGLCGLANDTKWDEFISAVRCHEEWRPNFRFKCVDRPPSSWDSEWLHHLPFPFISVEWFDVKFLHATRDNRLPPRTSLTDYSPWIEGMIRRIGFDYQKGRMMIRIFGYSPRSLELFDQELADKHRCKSEEQ